ncbi:hypothetical protein GCM10027347_14880 [Larkinella harenae]
MTRNVASVLISLVLLLAGCRNREREQQLILREQTLLEKEKQFALREADYQALTKMRDSLIAMQDTVVMVAAWPETIAGQWSSKVICTESNCSDYVVGDQRSDVWEFSSDSTQMVTKVINNNTLVRVYAARYANNEITLSFKTDSTASKKVEMSVVLNEISPNKLKGVRTLTIDDKCNARFTVDLTRIPNKE